jgi:hypothetical protein
MNQSDKQAAERGYRLFVEEIRKILNRSAILGEMHLKGVFNCEDVVWDKKSASDFLAVHQIFNEVTAGSEKTKRINRDWIDASFRKYKVEKTEEMLDKVYDKILENGYNVV